MITFATLGSYRNSLNLFKTPNIIPKRNIFTNKGYSINGINGIKLSSSTLLNKRFSHDAGASSIAPAASTTTYLTRRTSAAIIDDIANYSLSDDDFDDVDGYEKFKELANDAYDTLSKRKSNSMPDDDGEEKYDKDGKVAAPPSQNGPSHLRSRGNINDMFNEKPSKPAKAGNVYRVMDIEEFRATFLKQIKENHIHSAEMAHFVDKVRDLQEDIENYQRKKGKVMFRAKNKRNKIDTKIEEIYLEFIDDRKLEKKTKKEKMQDYFREINIDDKTRQALIQDYHFNKWQDYSMSMKKAFFNEACRKVANTLGDQDGIRTLIRHLINQMNKSQRKQEVRTFDDHDAEAKLTRIREAIMAFHLLKNGPEKERQGKEVCELIAKEAG